MVLNNINVLLTTLEVRGLKSVKRAAFLSRGSREDSVSPFTPSTRNCHIPWLKVFRSFDLCFPHHISFPDSDPLASLL